jgi:hypothetical protein
MRNLTFFAFLVVPMPLFAQTAAEKKATIQFLASLQQPDGGFIAAPIDPRLDQTPIPSLRATSAAVRAIQYLGGEVPNREKALTFVENCRNVESGAFGDTTGGTKDVPTTAIGMMAMAALQKEPDLDKSVKYVAVNAKTFEERRLAVAGMEAAKKFDPVIKEWIAEIAKEREASGGYGKDAREIGGYVAMILRSGDALSASDRRRVLVALHYGDGQLPDGGYGKADAKASDGETTYRVMRAIHLLKEKPKNVEMLRKFLASCRNKDGGYGVLLGQPSTVSGTYYAAVISHWLAE